MVRIPLATVVVLLCCPTAYAQPKSSDYTADYQQQALEIYRHIISIRSAEGHGNVPELANYLADRFRDGGFDDGDIHVLPQTLSRGEGTASLVVRYEGNAVTFMIQAAEKTYATFELTIRNPGGHSSLPRGDNAIYELATILRNIEAYTFPTQINDITQGYFEKTSAVAPAPVGGAMGRFAANPDDEEAISILSQVPSQNGLTRTTCVATMLSAGHAENALPQSATATVNCRIFPGVEVDDVRATLVEVAANDALEIETLDDPIASPASPLNEEVTAAVARVMGQQDYSPIGTDGRLYLHGLEQPSQVTVRWNGSICDFIVPKPEGTDMIPDLGEFTCEPREFR